MNKQACIFCDIVSPTKNNSVSCLEIFDNNYCKVILDIKPISRGHLIIIAKSHHSNAARELPQGRMRPLPYGWVRSDRR